MEKKREFWDKVTKTNGYHRQLYATQKDKTDTNQNESILNSMVMLKLFSG